LPSEKLDSVLNSCKIITRQLFNSIQSNQIKSKTDKKADILQQSGSVTGADDFLPMFIYLVLITNPTKLVANIEFCKNYCEKTESRAEAFYYLTMLESVVYFIENIDHSVLAMSEQEFESYMNGEIPRTDRTHQTGRRARSVSRKTSRPVTSDETLVDLKNSSDLTNSNEQQVINQKSELTSDQTQVVTEAYTSGMFTFEHSTSEFVRLDDVPLLLAEYNQLAEALELLHFQLSVFDETRKHSIPNFDSDIDIDFDC
jgi:hypothetical protein